MIGKYEVRGLLGKGGMGAVYKVRLPAIAKTAALKLLKPGEAMKAVLGMEEIESRFLDEARALGSIHHRNLAGILDFDRDERGRPFYVMEHYCANLGAVCGETYRADEPCRVLPVEIACDYVLQTLSGLDRLHHEGVVHRDIKPYNLLITPEEDIRIIDLGLSKLRGEGRATPGTMVVGTPFYAAPEQEADPDAADERSDLFGVGILLHRLLTGLLPEDGEGRPLGPASVIHPLLDRDWDRFLARAVHKDADERFKTAREMAASLEELFDSWWENLEGACSLAEVEGAGKGQNHEAPRTLRRDAVKVLPQNAREHFPVDRLWRPDPYIQNHFDTETDGIVLDRTTGLVWQASGPEYPLDWQGAQASVEDLNSAAFGSRTDWRLPTVDELLSLLEAPDGVEGICLSTVFDPDRLLLWSADTCAYTTAWFADGRLGYVDRRDRECLMWAKGVAGP